MRWLCLVGLLASCTGALRDRTWNRWPGTSDHQAAQSLIKHAIAAHGGMRAYDHGPILRVHLQDDWLGFARLRRPWPSDSMELVVDPKRSRLFMATSVEDLGAGMGWLWDGDRLFRMNGQSSKQLEEKPGLVFIMRALAYLLSLPFSLEGESGISYLGKFSKSFGEYHWLQMPETNLDPTWFLGIDPATGLIGSLVSPAPILAGNDIQFEAIWSQPVEVAGMVIPSIRKVKARDGEIAIHEVTLTNWRLASAQEARLMD